ncbi:MAG: hypothetical protein EA401_02705 [Planctomycetota bacterium]|nr:MAG: hypothetical protein EA401_02705 [Planctomycetota bacterium]
MTVQAVRPLSAHALGIGFVCWLLLSLYGVLSADETAPTHKLQWSYVPVAVFADTPFTVSLRATQQPSVQGVSDAGRLRASSANAWDLTIDPLADEERIILRSGEDVIRIHLRSVPTARDGYDLRRSPTFGGESDAVVLVAQRRKQAGDRRYSWLRRLQSPSFSQWQIQWPHAVTWGQSPLLASVEAWTQAINGDRILVLCYRDMYLGWSPQDYAATLSWILAAHQHAGHHVALLAPIIHPAEVQQSQVLLRTIRQVADDYAVPLIATESLQKEAYWHVAPDVAGTWFNATGRQALQDFLQPLTDALVDIPPEGFVQNGEE